MYNDHDYRRNNQRGNYRERPRPRRENRPRIDYWKKIKKIAYTEKDMGRHFIKLSIEVSRPVFIDEKEGFFQLGTMLQVNEHYLRIPPKILVEIMGLLGENKEAIMEAVDYVNEQNDIVRDEQEARRKSQEEDDHQPRKYRRQRSRGQ